MSDVIEGNTPPICVGCGQVFTEATPQDAVILPKAMAHKTCFEQDPGVVMALADKLPCHKCDVNEQVLAMLNQCVMMRKPEVIPKGEVWFYDRGQYMAFSLATWERLPGPEERVGKKKSRPQSWSADDTPPPPVQR